MWFQQLIRVVNVIIDCFILKYKKKQSYVLAWTHMMHLIVKDSDVYVL